MGSKKINIGLYIEGIGLHELDMRHPNEGNPGIGGTQYCFLLLAYYFSKAYHKDFNISIISHIPLQLPSNIYNLVINELNDIAKYKYDIVILKTPQKKESYNIISKLHGIKFITWSHNFLYSSTARLVSDTPNIIANVFVGKQMYDFYFDDDIIKKSTYIYNIVPDPFGSKPTIRHIPSHPVLTFMGSLTIEKGIITLLKLWKKVSKKYPEAKLNIIGGGNLYNREKELGSLGIVDKNTENLIRPYITTEDGKLDDRITFHGILGKEKYDIFLNSTVGIVNPSAKTETFGMGIIEMACASLPVVTRNWNGHLDTALNNKTALLGFSISSMAHAIDLLIQDPNLNTLLGKEAKNQAERFSPENVLPQWKMLIDNISNNNYRLKLLNPSAPYWNNYKFIRSINAFLRRTCHCSFLPSIVEYETWLYQTYKSIKAIIHK